MLAGHCVDVNCASLEASVFKPAGGRAVQRPSAVAILHKQGADPSSRQQRPRLLPLRGCRRASLKAAASSSSVNGSGVAVISDPAPPVHTGTWEWNGHKIRYQSCGSSGPAILLIHGFGANCDHFRKNLPELGRSCRAYAIDLLGYGYSDKPDPRSAPPNSIYNFENWGRQSTDFIQQVIGGPAACVCNSVGGLVGLQAAKTSPELVPAVMVINISLRMLHVSKQSPYQRPAVAALQNVLRESEVGRWFFKSVAKPQSVRNILRQCYGDPTAVTDELVEVILNPGLQPGAVDVFLDFISYSGGPMPEELMRDCPVPVSVVWGEVDPWEKYEWGIKFSDQTSYPAVEEFVNLPGVGHCPQDEAPHLVNPLVMRFAERHAAKLMTSA